MSQNMFANPTAHGPLTRATLGIGLTLAAIGAIGLGTGVAGASPQQPLLADDPVPAPTPVGANPASGVNIANAIFGELGSILNAVIPGSGSVFMPADSGTNSLLPGSANPSSLSPGSANPSLLSPAQIPGVPSYPGTVPPGYPSSVVPGQAPTLPGSTTVPGQAPTLPGATTVPGQAPTLPAQPSAASSADNVPIV